MELRTPAALICFRGRISRLDGVKHRRNPVFGERGGKRLKTKWLPFCGGQKRLQVTENKESIFFSERKRLEVTDNEPVVFS
jgi:hypothetical protein